MYYCPYFLCIWNFFDGAWYFQIFNLLLFINSQFFLDLFDYFLCLMNLFDFIYGIFSLEKN